MTAHHSMTAITTATKVHHAVLLRDLRSDPGQRRACKQSQTSSKQSLNNNVQQRAQTVRAEQKLAGILADHLSVQLRNHSRVAAIIPAPELNVVRLAAASFDTIARILLLGPQHSSCAKITFRCCDWARDQQDLEGH